MCRLQTKMHGDRYSNIIHGIQSNSLRKGNRDRTRLETVEIISSILVAHPLSTLIRFPSVRNDAWLPIIGVCRRLEPVLDTLTGVH